MSHAPEKPTVLSVEASPEKQAQPARCALAPGSAMATLQRITTGLGKPLVEYYEVPVMVLAVAQGYAMVRRPRCSPFVLEEKRVRMLPPPDTRHTYKPHKKYQFFCAQCGYAEHETIMHLPNAGGKP